jgi:cytoskeletal protein CcmA (bactofilin family)
MKSKSFSIIDNGVTLKGDLCFEGQLIIKGVVSGVLRGETLVVAEGATVCADIQADSITVAGRLEGCVCAGNTIRVLASGTCSGRIICRNLTVDVGGVIDAEIVCAQTSDVPGSAILKIPLTG